MFFYRLRAFRLRFRIFNLFLYFVKMYIDKVKGESGGVKTIYGFTSCIINLLIIMI